jgi:signal transduction histidine kinase
MESDIGDEQAVLIAEMHNALEKLSRIHSSLTLLTKLDNHEYDVKEPVCFSDSLTETLASFGELMEMKALVLHTRIEERVTLTLHGSLAELLLNNLVSNAIRHNHAGGTIDVLLNRMGLVIGNTGAAPSMPTSELFGRFKKGNGSGDSIGIGLAIVKQICDLHHFTVAYEWLDGHHLVSIGFLPSIPASKLLQNVERSLYHG